MGSIPFSDKPIIYEDSETGVRYFLRQPCGDTEEQISDVYSALPSEAFDKKKRFDFFSKKPGVIRALNNSIIDTILIKWESKNAKVVLPEFPKDGHPSQVMKRILKTNILDFYNKQEHFTGEEIKK